ncbi:conjugal transfer protein TraO [Flagellimonas sp. HMM57]|uniref:conjugal transfer protein TraO n=1 Tax=unclassified Flagellimonas TaxID=2644544 RepID=UPI0013D547CA|nr:MULTISPECIES: conjugal transfer protein TraO [unclassified Flagellimonas]UII77904.1 conjugal transfer protein TraO [Flagellimonas sp. HMM57]
MKKNCLHYLAFLAMLMISFEHVYSQRSDFFFDVVPSYKTNGYGLNANINYYHNTTDFFRVSFVFASTKEQPDGGLEFPYEDYLLDLGYFTTVLTSPNRGFFIYFGGGPSLGYKHINDGETDFPFDAVEAESSFIYGGFATFELDFFLSDTFSIILPVTGFYHFNSDLNETALLVGVGLRYYLD